MYVKLAPDLHLFQMCSGIVNVLQMVNFAATATVDSVLTTSIMKMKEKKQLRWYNLSLIYFKSLFLFLQDFNGKNADTIYFINCFKAT